MKKKQYSTFPISTMLTIFTKTQETLFLITIKKCIGKWSSKMNSCLSFKI